MVGWGGVVEGTEVLYAAATSKYHISAPRQFQALKLRVPGPQWPGEHFTVRLPLAAPLLPYIQYDHATNKHYFTAHNCLPQAPLISIARRRRRSWCALYESVRPAGGCEMG